MQHIFIITFFLLIRISGTAYCNESSSAFNEELLKDNPKVNATNKSKKESQNKNENPSINISNNASTTLYSQQYCPTPVPNQLCYNPIQREIYLRVLSQYFSLFPCTNDKFKALQNKILNWIYDYLGDNVESLFLFTTHAIRNTFNFAQLVGPEQADPYDTWRGLLQIAGIGNYETLNELENPCGKIDWVKSYEDLGKPIRDAVRITCKFWLETIYCKSNKTYNSVLFLLSPQVLLNLEKDPNNSVTWLMLKERRCTYFKLKKLFEESCKNEILCK